MRKPRDLKKYTDKRGALGFLFAMLADVLCEPDDIRLKFNLTINRWRPEQTEKKP